jgi:hypothetical protein
MTIIPRFRADHLSKPPYWWNRKMKTVDEIKRSCARKQGRPAGFEGTMLRNEVGVAFVELALVLPVLLLMGIGTIEFGRLAYCSIEVSNAAHAGAQYGSQSPTAAVDIAGMVQAALDDGINLSPALNATAAHFCQCSTGSSAPNCALTDCSGSRLIEYVQVNTSAKITPLFNYPGISSLFNLSGQAIMRVAQ